MAGLRAIRATNQPKYQTLRLTRPSGTRTHTQTNGDLPVRGGREAHSPATLMPRISESETTINALGLQGTAEGRTDRPDMMGGRKNGRTEADTRQGVMQRCPVLHDFGSLIAEPKPSSCCRFPSAMMANISLIATFVTRNKV